MTLPSNVPGSNNTPAHYKTHLPTQVEIVGEWEVALLEVHYFHDWCNFEPTAAVFIVKEDEPPQNDEPMQSDGAQIPDPVAKPQISAEMIEQVWLKLLWDRMTPILPRVPQSYTNLVYADLPEWILFETAEAGKYIVQLENEKQFHFTYEPNYKEGNAKMPRDLSNIRFVESLVLDMEIWLKRIDGSSGEDMSDIETEVAKRLISHEYFIEMTSTDPVSSTIVYQRRADDVELKLLMAGPGETEEQHAARLVEKQAIVEQVWMKLLWDRLPTEVKEIVANGLEATLYNAAE